MPTSTSARLETAVSDMAWRQWVSLGVLGEATGAETRSIDIEALTWFTFVPGGVEERRLQDAASDWLRLNRSLVSLHRLRNMHRSDRSSLEQLTAVLRGEGPPRRQRMDTTTKAEHPDALVPANLAIRLRLLFDAGIRSEVIRFLITTADPHPDTLAIADAASFAKRNVNDILLSLVAAGMAQESWEANRRVFSIDHGRWCAFLEIARDDVPTHLPWIRCFHAVRELRLWLAEDAASTRTTYLRSSDARTVLERVSPDLAACGLAPPRFRDLDPSQSLPALHDLVDAVVRLLIPQDVGRTTVARSGSPEPADPMPAQ